MRQQPRLHIFVLIDALGWKFLQGREFMSDLLPYRKPLRTVLGFSSGAIPTILTGAPPSETGHWNLFYYDPASSPFRWLRHFNFLSDRFLEHRVTRKLLKELGRHALGLGPLFECCVSTRLLPWFNWVEKRNIYEHGGIETRPTIFDQLDELGIPRRVYSYHSASDREIFRQAARDIETQKASFYFLYLSELDGFLHQHCNDTRRLDGQFTDYAAQLGRVFEEADRQSSNVTFTIFSDHGMTPVNQKYNLVKDVESLGFSSPRDYLSVYDSTMARFWFFSGQARKGITDLLGCLPCGRILPDAELKQLGVFFPDRRFGEVVFLLNPGCLLSSSDFHGGGWMPLGMHGYHPDDPYSDAVFLSNRQPLCSVENIADVYQCMTTATQELK